MVRTAAAVVGEHLAFTQHLWCGDRPIPFHFAVSVLADSAGHTSASSHGWDQCVSSVVDSNSSNSAWSCRRAGFGDSDCSAGSIFLRRKFGGRNVGAIARSGNRFHAALDQLGMGCDGSRLGGNWLPRALDSGRETSRWTRTHTQLGDTAICGRLSSGTKEILGDAIMSAMQTTSYAESRVELALSSDRNLAIGYLRAVIIVLVLAHHSVLAYHPYAPAPATSLVAQPRLWQAFPVVDSQRWSAFSMFVGFNDIFFMSLMFLLSGLFVWKSLQRKGSGVFLRDRILRLGLPFVVAAGLIAPLAYYPAYLQTGARGSFAGFWQQWRSLGNWPAGPAWFIWVLLAFDCVAAVLFLAAPEWVNLSGIFLKMHLAVP
jgi:hypothetical protein